MSTSTPPVGTLLRDWRQRRRKSQLDLALEAEVSARHLSFVETGRSRPSREMVLRLSRHLDVPPREQNALLVAAGHAPVFPERPLGDPELDAARRAVELILKGHEPVPALAVDRRWNLVSANRMAGLLMTDLAPELLSPPVNVVRASLHPNGLAPRIRNLDEWRGHILGRLEHEMELTGAPKLSELVAEIRAYPTMRRSRTTTTAPPPISRDVAVPIELEFGDDVLAFYSTTTVFGTPIDITLSELAIESFFPANDHTAEALSRMAREL